ncbi:MAG: pitrilysin family protein [Candidatus Aminicenantales bacterium]
MTPFKNIFSLFLAVGFLTLAAYSFGQEKTDHKYFVLENGLQVFLYERHSLPLLQIVTAVNLGSKDESNSTNGLVHLLEHLLLFRGTQQRNSNQISQDIRRHGAYFNAYTTQDLTLFEISLPSEYADFALQNQKEILFNLQLKPEEVEAEKEVILEEISQIEDDPLRYATSLAYQNLFKGHPYQNPLYGKKENIQAMTVDQLDAYYQRYFVPLNCALAVVGDFDFPGMEKKIRDLYGTVPKREWTALPPEKASLPDGVMEIEKEMDVQRAYLVIAFQGPDYNHPDQYAVDILTEIIGRGINPMINRALSGRRNLIHTIAMDYISHKYGGAILIYLTLEPKSLSAAKKEAIDFLKKVRRETFSKEDFFGGEQFYAYDFLQSAKNKIKFASFQAQEKGLLVARALASSMLLSESTKKGNFMEAIERIDSSDLREAAARYFSRTEYVVVSIVPKKDK